jgi:hypothetical protein
MPHGFDVVQDVFHGWVTERQNPVGSQHIVLRFLFWCSASETVI